MSCAELTKEEIHALPGEFARTALLAQDAGFNGVQIHAAHGFLLSQFLSPLFNARDDEYGGTVASRMIHLLDVLQDVRAIVGRGFPVGVRLNSSDLLEGGLNEADALSVIAALDKTGVDLIDISGGTYFPGARSTSDSSGKGPYFTDFAKRARSVAVEPLMVTGGFKRLEQAVNTVADGAADVVGLARAFAIKPSLPNSWRSGRDTEPAFPRFTDPPEGGITAWYTMRLTEVAEDRATLMAADLELAISQYEARDRDRTEIWLRHFSMPG